MFYKFVTDGMIDVTGITGYIAVFVSDSTAYVYCEGEGKDGWAGSTRAEFEAAGGIVP